MEAYQYIGYHLLSDTAVIDDVSNRVYHGSIPETVTTYPVINYFMVSRPNVAFGAAERPRFQISCRAETPAAAMDLAEKVKSAFTEIQNSTGGFNVQNTHFEGATFLTEPDNIYHVPVDVFITYLNT